LSTQAAPLVSVITPVYNGGKYLRECIESVLAQTYANWRYVIVNNRSTDDTLEIAQHYAQLDSRIRVHDNVEFLPIIENHSHAISLIDPESAYCKPLMADDWLYPKCIETMVRCALTQASIGLVCCLANDDNGAPNDRLRPGECAPGAPRTTILAGKTACRIPLLEERHFFGSPTTALIRSDLVRKRRPFYDPLNLHADAESCYDILQESDFAFVHEALAFSREHDQSHTARVEGLDSILAGRLYTLARYGHAYLSEEEFRRRFRDKLAEYYSRLAVRAVELRGRRYWEFHRTMLARIGAPLDRLRLTRAIAAHVARRATSPASLARGAARVVSALREPSHRKS
jgi:glycosyltransferase involved in cell wall biosynthesis